MNQAKRIAIGTCAALAAYLALCALLALLLTRGVLAESGMGAWVLAFACAASFAGAMTGAHGTGKRIMPAVASAATFWCAVMLLGVMMDEMPETGRAASMALAILLGGALSVPTYGKKKRGRVGGGHRRRLHK